VGRESKIPGKGDAPRPRFARGEGVKRLRGGARLVVRERSVRWNVDFIRSVWFGEQFV
jgi:hypothetical protein